MPNRFEIPEIDPEIQIAKGIGKDLEDWYAVKAVSVAVQWETDPEDPADKLLEYVNEQAKESYPDGPTPDMLGKGSWYEMMVNSHQASRKAVFRKLGGVTTLELLERTDSCPFSLDYLKKATVNADGKTAVRTEWETGLDVPQQYLDMFELKPPAEDEVPIREADPICFYDNGEYFFPTFQFTHEGERRAANIEVVERILRIEGKYPSFRAMTYWVNKVPGTKILLHEFTHPDNFNPSKLWDIYWPHSTERG